MEKFAVEDLKRLLDLAEEIRQKYPGIDIEITVSESADPDEENPELLRRQEQSLADELILLHSALAKYEVEFDILEDNMPDPYLEEHLEWLLKSGDVEDKIDDIEGRIAEIERELESIRSRLARTPKTE